MDTGGLRPRGRVKRSLGGAPARTAKASPPPHPTHPHPSPWLAASLTFQP